MIRQFCYWMSQLQALTALRRFK
uniref:Uncharacterized protein n=1 Tax=Rhizophora mucronata TaxID=61149 RepID=A0A2P2Q6S9_RHIMU